MIHRKSGLFSLFLAASLCFVGCNMFEKGGAKKIAYDINKALRYENVVPVAIIGSGPAGLSASLYASRAGLKSFVFSGPTPRGQLTTTTYIENWPGNKKVLGSTLMESVQEQAESFGSVVVPDTVVKIDTTRWPFVLTTENKKKVRALSVIMATGATPRTLGIEGEKEYWGKGVTTCAICDAPFFKNKEVVIVGGGDTAAEQVFELAPYVKKATMLVRKGKMRASQVMQERVAATPNAAVEYYSELVKVEGNGEEVTHVHILNNQTNEVEVHRMDGVFLAIGHTPNSKLVRESLKTDKLGYLTMKGRTQETSIPGIFAAGEVQDSRYRQAAVASGEGVCAALDAINFLYSLGFNNEVANKLDEKFFTSFNEHRLPIHELTSKEEFEHYVLEQEGVVLVDVYGKLCPACFKLLPILESVAYKLQDKVKVYKFDQHIAKSIAVLLAKEFGVRIKVLPSLFVFKNGKYMGSMNDAFSGIPKQSELYSYVENFLK